MATPSILIIDDGELDRTQALLERMQVDWMRCLEPDRDVPLERPRDLILSSGPRTMKMPPLSGDGQPLWVCIYDPDFLPLRERLRNLGVHFLVSDDLAPRTFELFIRQLLHRGEERRHVRRIPLHCEVDLTVGRQRRAALLLELSHESCVLSAPDAVAQGERVSLRVPAELTDDVDLKLSGTVIRANPASDPARERSITAVVRFESLDADGMARIHHLLSGHALGTPVTPLNAEPRALSADRARESWVLGAGHEFEDIQPDVGERRKAHRHHYGRRVDAVRWQGPAELPTALGKDLSLTGICIVVSLQPPLESEMTLALYGRAREEPLLVGARVVRVDRDEVGLRFTGLTASQIRSLERLIAAAPCVEDLDVAGGSRHVIELTPR